MCRGLVPSAGAPTTYALPAADQRCAAADSDGSGLVYATREIGHSPYDEATDVVQPNGTLIGTAHAPEYAWQPFAQLSGELALAPAEGGTPLWLVSPSGIATGPVATFATVRVANDPTGGLVVFDDGQNSGDMALHAFDAAGNARWTVSFAPPNTVFVSSIGVDRQGNVLLLRGESGSIIGFWVDHAGQRGPDFTVLSSEELNALGLGSGPILALEPQVGSGLFLRAGALTADQAPDPNSKWVKSIASLGTAPQPAPSWLTSRPGTDLQMIHGGTAYAVTSLQNSVSECSQAVEIVAADGTSCGTLHFDLGSGTCTTNPLKVGYDGTLIQQLPSSMETCTAQDTCSCTWRWWPALFH